MQIAGTLTSICVYNNAGSAAVVKIGIVVGGVTDRYLFSFNLAATGTATSSGYQLTSIVVKPTDKILIVTNQSVDYYITII